MFPLVHYFVNSQIINPVPSLMALGGLFPDIATAAGVDRDAAHSLGGPFHAWCKMSAPKMIPLAKGIISHGIDPHGVDYYADEYWPGGQKGWCFQHGEKYMAQVAQVTQLPPNLIWWKSHNFIEMGCELITDRDQPKIKDALRAAIEDRAAIREAAAALAAYTGIASENIVGAFARVPDIFAIDEISAKKLADKQNISFALRHRVTAADPPAMAKLICQISRELEPFYYPFFEKIIAKTGRVLSGY